MKIIDKYLSKNYLIAFLFVIAMLVVISIVVDYTEKIDAFVRNKIQAREIFNYYVAFLPFITAFLFPLITFIATVFYVSRIAYRSEIIAILNSGVSFNRFLKPFLWSSVLLAAFSFYANHFIIPKANKTRIEFENKYINSLAERSDNDIHVRIRPSEYIYIKNFNPIAQIGYFFTHEKIENGVLKEKISADEIRMDTILKKWVLSKVKIRKFDGDKEVFTHLAEMKENYPFTTKDFVIINEQKSTMTSDKLLAYIHQEEARGNPNLKSYNYEFHRRNASPLSVIILNIIGVCISSKKIRGGSGLQIAIGLLICGAYIIFMQFSSAFTIKGNLNPAVAAWIPNIIFAIIGLFIYRKMVD